VIFECFLTSLSTTAVSDVVYQQGETTLTTPVTFVATADCAATEYVNDWLTTSMQVKDKISGDVLDP